MLNAVDMRQVHEHCSVTQTVFDQAAEVNDQENYVNTSLVAFSSRLQIFDLSS